MDEALERAREQFVDGIEHFESGRLEQARSCFEASLALAPGRVSVLGNLGITLYHLGQWQEAIAVLRQVTAAEPDHAQAWICLGLSCEACAAWGEAADALERGLALESSRADLWLAYGQCLLRLSRADAALQAFDRALEIDAGIAEVWSVRGGLLRDLHRLEDAAHCFERAIALGADPELHAYYLAAVRGSGGPATPPRQYVEALFDDYSTDFESHLVDQLKYRGYEWLVRPLIASGRRFRSAVDLGCGTGLCGPLIAPIADDVAGIDISSAMLEQARKRGVYRELIHQDLVTFLAETDRTVDLVLAADVFNYLGDLDDVFRAVRRILEPGGCFVFTAELSSAEADVCLLPNLRYVHSEAYIRRLARTHGFKVRDLLTAPLRQDQQNPVEALYVYLD